MTIYRITYSCILALALFACSDNGVQTSVSPPFEPNQIIDLGALVNEDLPQRVWGKGFLATNNLDRPNVLEVVRNEFEGSVVVQNSFYTLANHGGPHVDAPNHVGFSAGIDQYPISVFSGPLKVFDVRDYPIGRTVPKDVFAEASINPGDVVMIYTGYTPPQTDDAIPETITLTPAAAEYLATIPIRKTGTAASARRHRSPSMHRSRRIRTRASRFARR